MLSRHSTDYFYLLTPLLTCFLHFYTAVNVTVTRFIVIDFKQLPTWKHARVPFIIRTHVMQAYCANLVRRSSDNINCSDES
jgi:hypothetical protein